MMHCSVYAFTCLFNEAQHESERKTNLNSFLLCLKLSVNIISVLVQAIIPFIYSVTNVKLCQLLTQLTFIPNEHTKETWYFKILFHCIHRSQNYSNDLHMRRIHLDALPNNHLLRLCTYHLLYHTNVNKYNEKFTNIFSRDKILEIKTKI